MKFLWSYFKKYRLESILAPLFKCLEACFDLAVPVIVAKIIDTGIATANKPYIISRFLLLLAMAVLGLVSSCVAQYFAAKAAIAPAKQQGKNDDDPQPVAVAEHATAIIAIAFAYAYRVSAGKIIICHLSIISFDFLFCIAGRALPRVHRYFRPRLCSTASAVVPRSRAIFWAICLS